VLRQDGDHHFELYSSAAVRDVARSQPAFAPFQNAPHHWHTVASDESFALDDRFHVRVVPVTGLTPGYDGRRPVPDAVVAYEIADGRGAGAVLFAPVFAAFEEPLRAAVGRSSLAFLDGSFWSDDELSELGVPKPAQSLGHLPVGGTDGSLAALGELGQTTRVGYAHVNNSSPLLDPASAPAREVRIAGVFVAEDGMEFQV
jgi:pyrroloquinoline quinone biosynthesis protein B